MYNFFISNDIDNLQMAVECNCKNFIANGTVQAFLDDIWNGGVKVYLNLDS